MGIFMESLPEEKQEEMRETMNPTPSECGHARDQYVTDGQRWCNTCDTKIERDGDSGFREYTDGRHDEAYNGGAE